MNQGVRKDGAALIYVIVVIVLISVLSAVILRMTAGSTAGYVMANSINQARYIAEAGLNYAAGQTESQTVQDLMEYWIPTGRIAHVQVNDPNRRGPGQGEMRFEPILRTLLRMQALGYYQGIVAVEPFDYVPDGPGCAARSIGYLKGIVEGLSVND